MLIKWEHLNIFGKVIIFFSFPLIILHQKEMFVIDPILIKKEYRGQ